MTEPADDRREQPAAAEAAGWAATLEELSELAGQRREDGWTVVTVAAAETTPEPPGASDSDTFGLVHVVPEDTVADLTATVDSAAIDQFETYRRTLAGTCYLVTELRDTEHRRCVLVAGAYDVADAEPLASHADDVGHILTRLQHPDGSLVAEVRHEAYEKLLPRSLLP